MSQVTEEYTKEQWARWAKYKSNKDLWIEQEENKLAELEEKVGVENAGVIINAMNDYE